VGSLPAKQCEKDVPSDNRREGPFSLFSCIRSGLLGVHEDDDNQIRSNSSAKQTPFRQSLPGD
jgi:hypothetical protein